MDFISESLAIGSRPKAQDLETQGMALLSQHSIKAVLNQTPVPQPSQASARILIASQTPIFMPNELALIVIIYSFSHIKKFCYGNIFICFFNLKRSFL